MSNQHLEAEVEHALGLDPTVNVNDVKVRVVEGVATLIGIVATLGEKEAAGRAAARVPGVRQVENRLTVTANEPVTDRELSGELDATLEALPGDLHRTVGAVSVHSIAHLKGHARSVAAADAAHKAAASVEGVKEVLNEIQIDAGAPMDEASVSNRVIQALVDSGLITSSTLEVDATGGEVVIMGIVINEADRERAEAIARAVPGVSRVTNRLKVEDLTEPRRDETSVGEGRSAGSPALAGKAAPTDTR